MPSAENEPDLFDVSLEDDTTTARKDRDSRKSRTASGGKGEPSAKRSKKNEKFGFGGKKRFGKSGDAASSADTKDYPGKRMKKPFKGGSAGGGGGGGSGGGFAKARPGKARRAKARL
jgi:rRNA-processing protein EBP2